MKFPGGLASMALAASLVTGCGGSDNDSGDEVHHPKYPDLFMTITGSEGEDGSAVWYECDDGYETYSAPRSDSTEDGTRVVCKPIYAGTTEAGDAYELQVTVGDAKETKEVVYEGKRIEIELAERVMFILEPDPL